eukprot:TRINITY_DN3261_c2_g1_i1.p1 TRINITY_DN3261_c2_g1~~TRINITY_DN3261_c2_g1_i1.p1  ORF type:complete len:713 (-),score=145.17 TRINITY_DN3261_c2_g1_i1:69-2207(-)
MSYYSNSSFLQDDEDSLDQTSKKHTCNTPCKYFKKGMCKLGTECRFLHVNPKIKRSDTDHELAVTKTVCNQICKYGRRPFLHLVVLYASDPRVTVYVQEVLDKFLKHGIDVAVQKHLQDNSKKRVLDVRTEHLAEIICSSHADFLIVVGDRNMKNKSCQAKRKGKLIEMKCVDMIALIWKSWPQNPQKTLVRIQNMTFDQTETLLYQYCGLKHIHDRLEYFHQTSKYFFNEVATESESTAFDSFTSLSSLISSSSSLIFNTSLGLNGASESPPKSPPASSLSESTGSVNASTSFDSMEEFFGLKWEQFSPPSNTWSSTPNLERTDKIDKSTQATSNKESPLISNPTPTPPPPPQSQPPQPKMSFSAKLFPEMRNPTPTIQIQTPNIPIVKKDEVEPTTEDIQREQKYSSDDSIQRDTSSTTSSSEGRETTDIPPSETIKDSDMSSKQPPPQLQINTKLVPEDVISKIATFEKCAIKFHKQIVKSIKFLNTLLVLQENPCAAMRGNVVSLDYKPNSSKIRRSSISNLLKYYIQRFLLLLLKDVENLFEVLSSNIIGFVECITLWEMYLAKHNRGGCWDDYVKENYYNLNDVIQSEEDATKKLEVASEDVETASTPSEQGTGLKIDKQRMDMESIESDNEDFIFGEDLVNEDEDEEDEDEEEEDEDMIMMNEFDVMNNQIETKGMSLKDHRQRMVMLEEKQLQQQQLQQQQQHQ